MHTNPCANMETHWPVHLKRDTRPTHFEREAGQYGPSVSRPIRSEMRRPRFAGTLRACKCTLSAGRSERECMTESCPLHPTHLWNPPLQKNRAARTQKHVIIDNGGSMVNDRNPIQRNGLLSASRKKVFQSPSAYSPLGRIIRDA